MSTPTEIINDARTYVATMSSAATAAVSEAVKAVEWVSRPYLDQIFVERPDNLGELIAPGELTIPNLDYRDISDTRPPDTKLDIQHIDPVDPGNAPTFEKNAPQVMLPDKPQRIEPFPDKSPSLDLSVLFPSAPNIIMPEAPVVGIYTAPSKPTTTIPTFDAISPTGLPEAPANLEGEFISAYHEVAPEFMSLINGHIDAQLTRLNPQYFQQMGRIEAQLTKYLDGGTGLNKTVEEAIYFRARERNDAEAARSREAAYLEAASRGFTLPSGALMTAVARARQEAANNNAKSSTDIAVAQAELEQRNLQFAVTTSVGLRTAMVNAMIAYMQNLVQINGQALDYAKSVLNALVEIYNIATRVFASKLEVYKAEATVFETRIRAALTGIEIYKAEIDALKALTQVDLTRVEVYKARIDVLTAATNLYRTQVEAAVSKASLQRLKIDIFQAQVQAFGAQVSAKNAEWQGYVSAVNGEEAKVRGFGAEVQAFNAKVQGYKSGIDAKIGAAQARATSNEASARGYSAAWDAYRIEVQAKGEVARTFLENQRQKVVAFQAKAAALTSKAQVKVEKYQAESAVTIKEADIRLQRNVAQVGASADRIRLLTSVHLANSTVQGNLASAALSGMNSLAASTEAI